MAATPLDQTQTTYQTVPIDQAQKIFPQRKTIRVMAAKKVSHFGQKTTSVLASERIFVQNKAKPN